MGVPSKRSRKAPESDSVFEDDGDLDGHELNVSLIYIIIGFS